MQRAHDEYRKSGVAVLAVSVDGEGAKAVKPFITEHKYTLPTPLDPPCINSQKQKEIDLADAILTCSELAAETYRSAGVPSEKLFPLSLGTDFVDIPKSNGPSDGPLRFVFVGSLIRRKGIDLLLNIFEEFGREEVSATLTLIGGAADSASVG